MLSRLCCFLIIFICLARFICHIARALTIKPCHAMPSILIQQQQQQQNEGKKCMYSLAWHVSTFQSQLHTYSLQQHRFCSIFIPFCPAFILSLSLSLFTHFPCLCLQLANIQLSAILFLLVFTHSDQGFFFYFFFRSSNIKIAAVFHACIAFASCC